MRSGLAVSVVGRFTQCHKGSVTMCLGEGWVLDRQCGLDRRHAGAESKTNRGSESLNLQEEIHIGTPEILFLISPCNNDLRGCEDSGVTCPHYARIHVCVYVCMYYVCVYVCMYIDVFGVTGHKHVSKSMSLRSDHPLWQRIRYQHVTTVTSLQSYPR
jgi:hypothetical protein